MGEPRLAQMEESPPQPALVLNFRRRNCSSQPVALPLPRRPVLTQMLCPDTLPSPGHAALTQTPCPHPGMPGTHPASAPSPGTTCVTVFMAFMWLNLSTFSLLAPEPRFLVKSLCPLVILTAACPGASAAPPLGRTRPAAYLSLP